MGTRKSVRARRGLISVNEGGQELRAAVLALRAAPRGLRNEINRHIRGTMGPEWKNAVHDNAPLHPRDYKLLTSGVRIAAGNPPTLYAGAGKRPVTKGKRLNPDQDWYLAEFGADPNRQITYRRRTPSGGTHQVTRRLGSTWPAPTARVGRKGTTIYPTVRQFAPRLMSMFVQTVVRTYMEILNPES